MDMELACDHESTLQTMLHLLFSDPVHSIADTLHICNGVRIPYTIQTLSIPSLIPCISATE